MMSVTGWLDGSDPNDGIDAIERSGENVEKCLMEVYDS